MNSSSGQENSHAAQLPPVRGTKGDKSSRKSVDKSGERVREMFAQIAPRYDLMNHVLSLGIDIRWRRRVLRELRLDDSLPILDCCTGTGDLALLLAQHVQGRVKVVGSDFCAPMLELARHKHQQKYASLPVEFVEADAQQLPFADASFQAVTVAFGLRNVQDTDAGLRELVRVCTPGGQVAVLEFSTPSLPGLRQAYQAYFRHVLPRIGQSFARNDKGAYEYLPNSVVEFPSGRALAERMESAGLQSIAIHSLTCGVASLYIGSALERRPQQGPSQVNQTDSAVENRLSRAGLTPPRPIVLAVTGASGAVYATRLLCALLSERVPVHLTISESGSAVIRQELNVAVGGNGERLWEAVAAADRLLQVEENAAWSAVSGQRQVEQAPGLLTIHHSKNFFTPIASGSFLTAGMVVCPCSGSTLSGIAHAASQNLIQRAAEVHLKEHRKLIIVPRETPLSVLQLENMQRLAHAGVVVLPAAPGWYHGVTGLCDLVDFVVGRILDQLGIENLAMQRWAAQ